jgi:hypothetical protein
MKDVLPFIVYIIHFVFVFVLWWHWALNSGPCTCSAGTLTAWTILPALFCNGFFFDTGNYLSGASPESTLCFWVDRITGMSHRYLAYTVHFKLDCYLLILEIWAFSIYSWCRPFMKYKIYTYFLKSIFWVFGCFFLGGTGIWTQGLTLARKALYNWSHAYSPFFSGYFLEIGSHELFPLWGIAGGAAILPTLPPK